MTLADLIAAAREDADDTAVGSFWSDAVLTRYANQAEQEAARRSRLLLDTETAAVCEYAVASSARAITLHPKIIFVRTLRLDSTTLPIPRIHVKDLDERIPDWLTADLAQPIVYIPNRQPGKLHFYPGFADADTVRLSVIRLPLVDMALTTDTPEIDARLHEYLVHWMVFRMLMKPDEDTKNEALAKTHLALFEQQFGPPSSAIDETWIQREHGYDEYEGIY